MKTWTKDKILDLLNNNDRAVERALLTLYRRQTEDEKRTETTCHENSVGFSQAHAHKFSSFAKQVERGYHLTERQLAWCRYYTNGNTRIGRYWAQLVAVANENERLKSPPPAPVARQLEIHM